MASPEPERVAELLALDVLIKPGADVNSSMARTP
jgi:hypothetical protein